MPTKFKIEIPIANVLKFTVVGENDNQRASFDQMRYASAKHAAMDERSYEMLMEKSDTNKIQVYTSFPAAWWKIFDCNTALLDEGNISRIREYRNQHYYSTCHFISVDGKLFIFFQNETQYGNADWTGPIMQTNFDGKLPPIEAEAGDVVRFKLAGVEYSTVIEEVLWNPELQAEGYLCDYAITLVDAEAGDVDIEYDAKDVDLWEFDLDLSSLVGEKIIFVELFFGLSTAAAIAHYRSEPVTMAVKHEDSLAVMYRHSGEFNQPDMWSFEYPIDYYSIIRFPAQFFRVIPAGELESDVNDTGVQRLSRSIPFRQIELTIMNIPSWIMDKLMIIFSHDTKIINDYLYEIDTYGSYEGIQQVDLGSLQIPLRQKDDRTKFVREYESTLTAHFDPPTFTGLDSLGAYFSSTFHTNSGQQFAFLSVPAGLSPDVPTFVDGDTIDFTLDQNPTLFTRLINLIAQSAAFGGDLQATLGIAQLPFVPVEEPDFLSITPADWTFAPAGGVKAFGVASSGSWSVISNSNPTFVAVEATGDRLDISVVANNTTAMRESTIRIALDSEPTVFADVHVNQYVLLKMISVTPTTTNVGANFSTIFLNVQVAPGTQWKATSPNNNGMGDNSDWVHFNTSTHTNSVGGFLVSCDTIPEGQYGRGTSITFYNVANPSDSITVNILQTNI